MHFEPRAARRATLLRQQHLLEPSPVPRSEMADIRTIVQWFFVDDHAKTGGFCPFPFRRGVPLLFKCVPRPVRSTVYGRNGWERQNGRVVACNLNDSV